MPIMPIAAVWRAGRVCCDSHDGRVLDRVGDVRRDRVAREIGRADGKDRMAHRREVAREADEPRLVDARGVHAGDEQEGAPRLRARQVPARRKRRRRARESSSALLVTVPCSQSATRAREAVHAGGLDDERGAAHVVVGGDVAGTERRQNERRPPLRVGATACGRIIARDCDRGAATDPRP